MSWLTQKAFEWSVGGVWWLICQFVAAIGFWGCVAILCGMFMCLTLSAKAMRFIASGRGMVVTAIGLVVALLMLGSAKPAKPPIIDPGGNEPQKIVRPTPKPVERPKAKATLAAAIRPTPVPPELLTPIDMTPIDMTPMAGPMLPPLPFDFDPFAMPAMPVHLPMVAAVPHHATPNAHPMASKAAMAAHATAAAKAAMGSGHPVFHANGGMTLANGKHLTPAEVKHMARQHQAAVDHQAVTSAFNQMMQQHQAAMAAGMTHPAMHQTPAANHRGTAHAGGGPAIGGHIAGPMMGGHAGGMPMGGPMPNLESPMNGMPGGFHPGGMAPMQAGGTAHSSGHPLGHR